MASETISTNELVSALAAVLGHDGAREKVAQALRALGLAEGRLTRELAGKALEHVERGGGVAAAAARLAQRRLATGRLQEAGASSSKGAAVQPFSRADLVALLSASIGDEAARAAVARGAQKAGMGDTGSREQALATLDAVAGEPGIVGTTARFAKARLHLK